MSFEIIHPHGGVKYMDKIKNLDDATWKGVRQGFHALGHRLRTLAKDGIKNPPKTGKLYPRPPNFKRRYRASRQGEAPANPTGNLRSSVDFQIQGVSNMEFGYRKKGKLDPRRNHGGKGTQPFAGVYGRKLELSMKRPNLSTAVKKTQATAHTYFELEIKKALMTQ